MKARNFAQEPFDLPITLSIAAPAYNEADSIEAVLTNWIKFLLKQKKIIKKFEIIICNDGSTDDTPDILNRLSSMYNQIRIVHSIQNRGAAAALAIAISETKYQWVLLLDSDGQFPIENFSKLWGALEKSKSLSAIGLRKKKDTIFARFGTYSSGILCNIFHNSKIKDFNSALKLSWGPLLRSFHFEARGMNYSTEITSLLLRAKVNIVQVDSIHIQRAGGKSKIKFLRDAMHRFLFVLYLGLKIFLTSIKVLSESRYEK